ncbi:hypothetical protein ACFV1C_00285 [Streptomyces sp. NPDC059605]|uniref:hypothetical protein n=1 Tax=Streptomyces sp. NPDC059605 TaxID=3346882 RepID=UPI003679957F
MTLPPYSADFPKCPKCHFGEAATAYRAAGEHSTRDQKGIPCSSGERHERTCLRCGYTWDEAVADDLT